MNASIYKIFIKKLGLSSASIKHITQSEKNKIKIKIEINRKQTRKKSN